MKKRVLALLLTGTLFVQSGIALAAEISVDDSAEIEEVTEEIVVSDSEDTEETIEPVEAEEAADETQETESEETVAEESVQAITVEDGTVVDSGFCGYTEDHNVTWKLDSNGTLTISGTGWTADWSIYSGKSAPWFDKRDCIKQVVVESGVRSIGNFAFFGCSSLTSVTLPDYMVHLGNSAFEGCSRLSSITIPDSVGYIGNSAFSGCSNLTSITMPSELNGIHHHTFYGCSSLQGSIKIPNGASIIGECAFTGCSSLTSITIPESVSDIGQYAFERCSSLQGSIKIPNGMSKVGDYTFAGCSSLTSITIPNSVTNIGQYAFYKCNSLTSITIPNGVTNIGINAFYECSSLTSIEIPDSVTSMGNIVFYGCTNLNTISLPSKMTTTEDAANFCCDFFGCSSLTSIIIPDGMSKVGDYTFAGCSSLTSITIPNSVTNIGQYAFYECSSLVNIEIPDSVTSIGENVFSGCLGLESIEVEPSNPSYKSIDGILYNKSGTEIIAYPEAKPRYIVPEEIEEIPDNAFGDNLTDLTVGTGVTSVGDKIFDAAEPEETSTPSISTQSVIKIASGTKKVTFKGKAPKFKSNTFKGKTVIAYYPAGNSTWTSSVRKNYGGTVTWIATGKIPASSCSMTLSKTIFTYNGKVQNPTVTIKDPNGKTISSGNYKVTYSSGCRNIGEYKVTVKFNGSKYTGSMSKTFTIGPKSTSLKSLTTGTKCFTVKWTKQPTLTSGYQLRYATNSKFTGAKTVTIASIKTTSKKITGLKDATKYYVQIRTYKTVSGKKYYSNWSSAKTVTTKAPVPKATSLTSVTAASKGFTAKWSKQTTQTTGYQLQYSTSSKFTGAKTVWITSNKTTSKKISGLTAKKKYYVRIRTYKTLNGKKYYSSWSKTKTVTTKK